MQNIGTYWFENKRPAKHIYIFRLTVSSILVLINGSTIFFSLVEFKGVGFLGGIFIYLLFDINSHRNSSIAF